MHRNRHQTLHPLVQCPLDFTSTHPALIMLCCVYCSCRNRHEKLVLVSKISRGFAFGAKMRHFVTSPTRSQMRTFFEMFIIHEQIRYNSVLYTELDDFSHGTRISYSGWRARSTSSSVKPYGRANRLGGRNLPFNVDIVL